MRDNRRIKEISLIVQERMLLKAFPNSKTKRSRFKIIWTGCLKPTSLSREYTIEVTLEEGNIKVFVKEPKTLDLYPGAKILPHVYSTPQQQLCLFLPNSGEWNNGKLLLNTIVPWASEWLYFYEIWLFTGEWLGGGTEHNLED